MKVFRAETKDGLGIYRNAASNICIWAQCCEDAEDNHHPNPKADEKFLKEYYNKGFNSLFGFN